jgi:hypothetical protein
MDEDERDFWDDDEWGDHDDGTDPPADEWADDEIGEPTIDEIIQSLGRNSEIDFLVNLKDINNGSSIRSDRFSTLADAIYFLYEIGVGSFSDVIEIEVDVYAVVIPDDTQGN